MSLVYVCLVDIILRVFLGIRCVNSFVIIYITTYLCIVYIMSPSCVESICYISMCYAGIHHVIDT